VEGEVNLWRRRPTTHVVPARVEPRPPTAAELWDRYLALTAEWKRDHPDEPVPSVSADIKAVLGLTK